VVVLGTGHVGLVTAATLAHLGHEVVGYDDDQAKMDLLARGKVPFFEPGLQELLDAGTATGRLRFSRESREAIGWADVHFVCVGTPARPDGETNLAAVEKAAFAIRDLAAREAVVVHKSTVPVKTAERVAEALGRRGDVAFHVVSNPEFLREGTAVQDSLHPDRILVGVGDEHAAGVMRELYAPLIERGTPYFETDVATAELAKHACNAFLALKISYANSLARLCEASGADVALIADIMGADDRIGRAFLDAGLGYGGYCLPKDVAAFKAQAARAGVEFGLLEETMKANEEALEAAFRKIENALWNLDGKRVALLGLAFKPGTDDVRESPALKLAVRLRAAGAHPVGYDPEAGQAAVRIVPELQVAADPYHAATDAHCLVICTAWPEFAALDLVRLKGVMAMPVLVDGRNVFDHRAMERLGFTYLPTGRPSADA